MHVALARGANGLAIDCRDLSRARHFGHTDRRRFQQAAIAQPRRRLAHGWSFVISWEWCVLRNLIAPPAEHETTRIRIQPAAEQRVGTVVIAVTTPVVEHVCDGVSNLTNRVETLAMIAVREHSTRMGNSPPTRVRRVEPLCRRDLERTNSVGEALPITRLDDQVEVRVLYADVNDAKLVATYQSRR